MDLETPRLILKEFNPNIQQELLRSPQKKQAAFLGSRGVMEFLALRAQFLEPYVHTNRQTFRHWLILDKENCNVIGDCGFHRWYHLQQFAEIGYGLRREEDMGKGIMMEAVSHIIPIGFKEMDLIRIEAFVKPDNNGSLKILHNLGFKAEGRLKARYDRGNSDMIILKLEPEAFPLEPSKLPYIVQAFEKGTLPGNQWTHQAHLKVGLWYALNHNYEQALLKMRNGIQFYNNITGIPNTENRGYHETMTQFWLKTLYQFIEECGCTNYVKLLEKLFESEYSSKNYPLRFYTKEEIASTKARAIYLAPTKKLNPNILK